MESKGNSGLAKTHQQEVVRGVILLIHLIGAHCARFMPQIMVLLNTSMASNKPEEVKLQALEGWRILVENLATHDKAALSSIINQVCKRTLTPDKHVSHRRILTSSRLLDLSNIQLQDWDKIGTSL